MDKNDVIKAITEKTISAKKRIAALDNLLCKIKIIDVVNLENKDKEVIIFLSCFSYYENFIKETYLKVFNYVQFLKKYGKPYPPVFNNLAFLYHDLGKKKTKIRHFENVKTKKYLDHFSLDNFLKENQKLNSIEHLLKFNIIISEKNISEYLDYSVNSNYEETIKTLGELYEQRNDKIHGNYSLENETDFKKFFISAINLVSTSLIDALELKF